MKSIFSIIAALNTMEYKFKNGVVFEIPKILIIIATNPLVCYLIVKVSYTKLLLITKLIFIDIKFEIPGKAGPTYDG